jgi:uncharacterized phage protein (TIGR01671 family)
MLGGETRMRELRFRAWLKREKIMTIPEYITLFSNGDYVLNWTNVDFENRRKYSAYYSHVKPSTFELMQFTGLKDQNGVDIYEGDVVEFESGAYAQGTWEFQDRGVVKYLDGKWWLKTNKELLDFADYCSNVEPEVVGNVFENPELLKEVD